MSVKTFQYENQNFAEKDGVCKRKLLQKQITMVNSNLIEHHRLKKLNKFRNARLIRL